MICPVSTLVMVTLAPPITADEGSVTLPTILPVPTVVWANNLPSKLKSVSMGRSTTATHTSLRNICCGADIFLPAFLEIIGLYQEDAREVALLEDNNITMDF